MAAVLGRQVELGTELKKLEANSVIYVLASFAVCVSGSLLVQTLV